MAVIPVGILVGVRLHRMLRPGCHRRATPATRAERAILLKRHNSGFWRDRTRLFAAQPAAAGLDHPARVLGLVYVHYGLDALQRLRQERTIDV